VPALDGHPGVEIVETKIGGGHHLREHDDLTASCRL
jgi:hypothetical protein